MRDGVTVGLREQLGCWHGLIVGGMTDTESVGIRNGGG